MDGRPVAFLYASDRERALDFYCSTLGLTLRSSDPHGDFLEMGPALVRMTVMPDYRASPHPALGWDVADIRAAVTGLREKGIAFTLFESFGQDDLGIWTSPDGSALAWFADPDGNVLMLSQS